MSETQRIYQQSILRDQERRNAKRLRVWKEKMQALKNKGVKV